MTRDLTGLDADTDSAVNHYFSTKRAGRVDGSGRKCRLGRLGRHRRLKFGDFLAQPLGVFGAP